MKLSILLASIFLWMAGSAIAGTVIYSPDKSVKMTIPDTYFEDRSHISEQIAPMRQFMRLGGRRAFYDVFPHDSEPAWSWKDEVFVEDISAFIRVGIIPLNEFGEEAQALAGSGTSGHDTETATATQIFHNAFCEDFKSSWGSGASCYHDKDKDVGVGVNTLGAFVTNSYRVIGDHVLLVGSMDLIGMLKLYSHEAVVWGPDAKGSIGGLANLETFKESSDQEKWDVLREAANSDDVFKMLLTARLHHVEDADD
ncbi:hypothetical protein [Pyruvatibacter sp.]|uniref:hypothetical protein n=1 Tax=Pyruvatibacter sp. TaxID=1981328 RepID=UPI00326797D9